MKIISSIFCLLLLINSFAYSQRDYSKIPYAFVLKNNDTIICKEAGWTANYGAMKCNGKKIDFKTMIRYGYFWDMSLIDIDKPDGEQELRLARVPKVLYTDTNKVAIVIGFYKLKNLGGGKVDKYGRQGETTTNYSYEEKPECYEFIKKRIIHDLDSLKIKPVIVLNEGTTNRGIMVSFTNPQIAKSGANVIIHYTFYDSPNTIKEEKGETEFDKFDKLVLTIMIPSGGYHVPIYASEDQSGKLIRFNYRKTWRKFLIDYETYSPLKSK